MKLFGFNKNTIAILMAFSAAGIWGFLSIPLRGLSAYSSEQILFYRILVSLIFLFLFQVFFNRKRVLEDWNQFRALNKKESRRWIWISLLSSGLITLNWYSFIFVINHINIQSAAFAYMVCPLLTAFIAFLVLKERITQVQKAALILALLAIFVLAYRYQLDVLFSILVAIWYAIYLVIQKLSPPIEKGLFLTIQLLFSALLIIPYFLFKNPGFPMEWKFWIDIVLISILFTIVPLYLSLFALETISSTTMGIIIYFNPIVAFSVALIYFHESLNFFKLSSYFLVFIAVIIYNWQYFQNQAKKPILP